MVGADGECGRGVVVSTRSAELDPKESELQPTEKSRLEPADQVEVGQP